MFLCFTPSFSRKNYKSLSTSFSCFHHHLNNSRTYTKRCIILSCVGELVTSVQKEGSNNNVPLCFLGPGKLFHKRWENPHPSFHQRLGQVMSRQVDAVECVWYTQVIDNILNPQLPQKYPLPSSSQFLSRPATKSCTDSRSRFKWRSEGQTQFHNQLCDVSDTLTHFSN